MRLLILGGTVFLGRHLVGAARARGHAVTLFNRGQHNPELFPGVEKLLGDRSGNLDALRGRRWDAVIDTCGYVPRVVRQAAEVLAGAVEHYTFVSSLSVYADTSRPGVNEDDPVGALPDESIEEITGETYGPLKALCEQAAERAMPDRVLTVRPGLIVGPHDPTDRFTYWPARAARGGDMLAPGQADRPVAFIDVRDLAEWLIRMIEARWTGVYNADGPNYELNMGRLLAVCAAVSGSDARPVWVDGQFLIEAGVEPWGEMPLWIPESDPMAAGFFKFSIERALTAGLRFRSLEDRFELHWIGMRRYRRTGIGARVSGRNAKQSCSSCGVSARAAARPSRPGAI